MSGPAEDSTYGRELADAQLLAVKDARIRQLEADLAAMTAERDELRKAIRTLAGDFNDLGERCGAAESDLAAAREEIERLRRGEVI